LIRARLLAISGSLRAVSSNASLAIVVAAWLSGLAADARDKASQA
jgi:NAD(P)H-dependent FMN reductase